jgi:hypothetical protein
MTKLPYLCSSSDTLVICEYWNKQEKEKARLSLFMPQGHAYKREVWLHSFLTFIIQMDCPHPVK